MPNTGETFERRVFKWLREKVQSGAFGLTPANARVVRQPAYWSQDRQKDIVFDHSIEMTRTGATKPFLVWIWECKDYTHAVPVDDVEEFHAKLQQIGSDRTKGTIITTSNFQVGGLNFAKANGIGLIRILPASKSLPGENRLVIKDNRVLHMYEYLSASELTRERSPEDYKAVWDVLAVLLELVVTEEMFQELLQNLGRDDVRRALTGDSIAPLNIYDRVYAQALSGDLFCCVGLGRYVQKEWEDIENRA